MDSFPSGCSSLSDAEDGDNEGSFRILTWNILAQGKNLIPIFLLCMLSNAKVR